MRDFKIFLQANHGTKIIITKSAIKMKITSFKLNHNFEEMTVLTLMTLLPVLRI